jgi:hypothetical protein
MLSSYNLFRRKREPDLCCAVRQDKPVPSFVRGSEWEFGGTVVDNGGPTPAGFQLGAAQEATQAAGFYIFQIMTTKPAPLRPIADGKPAGGDGLRRDQGSRRTIPRGSLHS